MASGWPSTLPQVPLEDGLSYVSWDNVIRSQMDVGRKTRPRFTAVGEDVSMRLMLTKAQVETLQNFYEITLRFTLPFTWKHFRRVGNPAVDYCFKSAPKYAPAGGGMWTADLELERMP